MSRIVPSSLPQAETWRLFAMFAAVMTVGIVLMFAIVMVL